MTKQPIFTADIAKMISDVSLGLWANPQNDSNLIGTYRKEATSHVVECLVLASGEAFSSFTRDVYEFLMEWEGPSYSDELFKNLFLSLNEGIGELYPIEYVKALKEPFNSKRLALFFGFLNDHRSNFDVDCYSPLVIEMYNMLKAEGL